MKFLPSGPELIAGALVFMAGAALWELVGRDFVMQLKSGIQ